MFLLPKDLPKDECIRAIAEEHPTADAVAIESYLWLLRLATDIAAVCEAYFARFGLSQARFTVLMLCRRAEHGSSCEAEHAVPTALTPSDLAERCGVSRATMTGLLDGLERDSLIARGRPASPGEGDRRSVTVRLTAPGRELIESLLPGYFGLISELMRGLDARGLAQLSSLLKQLRLELPGMPHSAAQSAAGEPGVSETAKEAVV